MKTFHVMDPLRRMLRPVERVAVRMPVALTGLTIASSSNAAFLSGEALDTMADYLAIFVLLVVPAAVIVLFWIVHVMPEKIAEKRHHPQKDAIHTLCILSLFFGGLLWPIAWLWAYTKPVGYKLAYGTERHDDYYVDMVERARAGTLSPQEVASLRDELDTMEARSQLSPRVRTLRDDLAAWHAEALAADRSEAASREPVATAKAGD